jgi:hypothetical protein
MVALGRRTTSTQPRFCTCWRRNKGIVGNNVGLKQRSATIDPLGHTTLWPEIDVKGEHAAAVDTSVCQPSTTLRLNVTSVGLHAKMMFSKFVSNKNSVWKTRGCGVRLGHLFNEPEDHDSRCDVRLATFSFVALLERLHRLAQRRPGQHTHRKKGRNPILKCQLVIHQIVAVVTAPAVPHGQKARSLTVASQEHHESCMARNLMPLPNDHHQLQVK